MSTIFIRRVSSASANWWEAGGATGCLAAYQPKGAASLAASYTNLANPGTYTAAPGTAPTWATGTGWTFNGTSQHLKAGMVDTATMSLIVRFANGITTNTHNCAIGSSWCQILTYGTNYSNKGVYQHGGSVLLALAGYTSGVMALTPSNGYYNGASIGAIPSVSVLGRMIILGASGGNAGGTFVASYFGGDIIAAAVYSGSLSSGEVAAISTAMAAL